uniref:PTTG1 interacting protein n=1 Tax=Gadus morhua TaxID=8049 RepID=A0A8C5FWB8_GADMO
LTACELMNASNCEGCLANVSCLWCLTSEKCITYPVSTILPPHAVCPLNDARWGLCWMNFQILIITLSVVGAVIILAFIVCLLCCCKCQNWSPSLSLPFYVLKDNIVVRLSILLF